MEAITFSNVLIIVLVLIVGEHGKREKNKTMKLENRTEGEQGAIIGEVTKDYHVPNIHSYCQIDKRKTEWEYRGDQEDGKGGKIHLYTCLGCGTTRSMGHIMSFNFEVRLSVGVEPQWKAPSRETKR